MNYEQKLKYINEMINSLNSDQLDLALYMLANYKNIQDDLIEVLESIPDTNEI